MPITKDHAREIVKKLGAEQRTGRRRSPHEYYVVYHGETQVAQFGIRHGSNRNQSHDHIPRDLHLTHSETLNLANCPLTATRYFELMEERGRL